MTRFSATRPIKRGDPVSRFDCGLAALNAWLRNHAIRNQDSGASRTFITMADPSTIAGYYSLSAFTVARADVGGLGMAMPDPIPVTLIGRLAVDRRCAGQGLGANLLRDAALRARGAGMISTRPFVTMAERS
jgi:predicted N-acetyltransferase YhbS